MDDLPDNHTALNLNHTHPSLTFWWNTSSWSKHLDELVFFDVNFLPFMPIYPHFQTTIPYESQVSYACLVEAFAKKYHNMFSILIYVLYLLPKLINDLSCL